MGEKSSEYDAKYRNFPFGEDESAVVPPLNLEEDKEKPEKGKEAKSIESTESKTREERMQEARRAFDLSANQEIPLMRGTENLGDGWKLVNVTEDGTAVFNREKHGSLDREEEIIERKYYPKKAEPASLEPESTEEQNIAEKIHSLLDKDIQELENPKEPKWSKEAYSWLQKNSKLRMATGVITSVLGAYFGGNVGIYTAKGVMGAISGGIGFSGLNSYLKEKAALKNFEKLANENGELDLNKIADRLNNRHTIYLNENQQDTNSPQVFDDAKTKKELLDLYAEFTEISSAKGLKIMEELDDKSEKSKNVLQEKFPRLFDNKAVNWYRSKNWYTKALIGLGVGVGAGFLGGAVFGGALTARVACSGIASLGMTAFQDTDDRSGKSKRYANSKKVFKLKDALEKIGLSDEDMQYIAKHREEIKKRSVAIGITGAAVMGIILAEFSYNSSHHQGAESEGSNVSKEATETTPDLSVKSTAPAQTLEPSKEAVIPRVGGSDEPDLLHAADGGKHVEAMTAEEHLKAIKGSSNLIEEKANAGGSLKGQKGDEFMGKIYHGLEGKQGLPAGAGNEDQVIQDMTSEAREMGIIDADGNLTDKIDAGQFDPQKFTQAIVAHDSNYLNTLGNDLTLYEQSHLATQHTADLATHDGGHDGHAGHGAGTPEQHAGPQSETQVKEHLERAAGIKTPPTWHIGSNFEAYNHGKPLTEAGLIDQLKDKQIGRDSYNYLHRLLENKTVDLKDIHLTPDGKQLMFHSNNPLFKGVVWTDNIHDKKSFFAGLFSGKTEDVTKLVPKGIATELHPVLNPDTVPGKTGQPGGEAEIWQGGKRIDVPASGENATALHPEVAGSMKQDDITVTQGNQGTPISDANHPVIPGAEHATPHINPEVNPDTANLPGPVKELVDNGGAFRGLKNGVYKIIDTDGKPGYIGPVDPGSADYKKYMDDAMANFSSYKAAHPEANILGYKEFVKMNAAGEILKQRFGDK